MGRSSRRPETASPLSHLGSCASREPSKQDCRFLSSKAGLDDQSAQLDLVASVGFSLGRGHTSVTHLHPANSVRRSSRAARSFRRVDRRQPYRHLRELIALPTYGPLPFYFRRGPLLRVSFPRLQGLHASPARECERSGPSSGHSRDRPTGGSSIPSDFLRDESRKKKRGTETRCRWFAGNVFRVAILALFVAKRPRVSRVVAVTGLQPHMPRSASLQYVQQRLGILQVPGVEAPR